MDFFVNLPAPVLAFLVVASIWTAVYILRPFFQEEEEDTPHPRLRRDVPFDEARGSDGEPLR